MLDHETSLHKFKNIEIILSVFSDHSGIKVEIDYKRKTEENTDTWRLNNVLLSNQWVTEEIKEEI